ncbi:MAG: DUF1800 domain-containing protein [Acidobacteria bacterium]|nr:MAG: DUF1800 domain-containing protein [Acidobacteriota bacterium]
MSLPVRLRTRPIHAAAVLGAIALALPGSASVSLDRDALSKSLSASPLTEEQKVVHVLDRLGYGPRPGDVEKVRALGLAEYIARQLEPERIDDSAASARLERLETTRMSSRELGEIFSRAQAARKKRARQNPEGEAKRPPPDPALRMEMAGQRKIGLELAQAKLLAATYSERQLKEVMADFWFNHFNIFIGKGADRVLTTEYDRDVIRPNALGNFSDLLVATAKSPAMLFYLDNWLSVDPNAKPPERNARGRFRGRMKVAQQVAKPGKKARGLNENYARELMELHTLGVDGGYTQKDVTEVARCFTGWTLRNPRQGGGFQFVSFLHDNGSKTVLGRKVPAGGGMRDGEIVLELLAKHPSTARFVSTKLCRRFVSDNPPESLVARSAEIFLKTRGDIRQVLAAIFTSREFYSPEAYRAKIKKPFQLVVSALRATGAETIAPPVMIAALRAMGEMPYGCQPPTGYPDTADAWVNTGALLERMNFATRLAAGDLPGTRTRLAELAPAEAPTAEIVSKLARELLREPPSQELARDIEKQVAVGSEGGEKVTRIAALILGSPEFQRH